MPTFSSVRFTLLFAVFAVGRPLGVAWAQPGDEQRAQCAAGVPALRIEACTALIQSGFETPESLVARGVAYRAAGDTARAMADYDEAIRLKPDYAPAFNYRGNAYVAMGEDARGLKDLDEALRLKPDYHVALNNRAFTYLKMKQYALAVADYDAALRINPRRANSLFGRALAHSALGDAAKAEADATAAKRLQPDIEQVYAGYGMTLEKQ